MAQSVVIFFSPNAGRHCNTVSHSSNVTTEFVDKHKKTNLPIYHYCGWFRNPKQPLWDVFLKPVVNNGDFNYQTPSTGINLAGFLVAITSINLGRECAKLLIHIFQLLKSPSLMAENGPEKWHQGDFGKPIISNIESLNGIHFSWGMKHYKNVYGICLRDFILRIARCFFWLVSYNNDPLYLVFQPQVTHL